MRNQVTAQALPDAESLTIDPDNYYRQVLHGYYQFDCVVEEGTVRSAKFYIPENTVFNQPTVFVAVPDGEESWDFLVKSGWKQMADERQICVVLMEPENGCWENGEKDIAYITALNEDVSFRPFFCAFSSNFYGAAYGKAADVLGKQSRMYPKCWAGLALLGGTGMTEEEVRFLETKETKVPGVTYSQVQMPVWIAAPEKEEPVDRELAFYRNGDHSRNGSTEEDGREIWDPEEGGTPDEHWCARVVFDRREWTDCLGYDYDRRIWDTVFAGVYRYPGNRNGALRRNRDIRSRGFQKFSEKVAGGFYEDGRDSYR